MAVIITGSRAAVTLPGSKIARIFMVPNPNVAASSVSFAPVGSISSTNVQTAIAELDERVDSSVFPTSTIVRFSLGAKNAYGSVFAFGRNADNLAQGVQFGGGNPEDGTDGVMVAVDGYAGWERHQPSKNESPLEFLLYPSASAGRATLNSGGNTVSLVSGTPFTSAWIGKKIYLGRAVYRVATVPTSSSMTVTTTGGGGVTFGSTSTVTFHVFQNTGTGLCNISGTTVTRVSGDPFVPFISGGDFTFQINGTTQTISTFNNTSSLTLSAAPGDVVGATYTFRFDINDSLVLFRLQKLVGAIEENLSIFARYDGYWFRAQRLGSGEMYPIRFSSGELSGAPFQQIVLQSNGDLTFGGDYADDSFRILARAGAIANRVDFAGAPTGFSPAFRARGTDANVGIGFDTQQGGSVTFTSGGFAITTFQILSNGGLQGRLAGFGNYANDAAAAAGGVAVGGFYRNGSAIMIRAA